MADPSTAERTTLSDRRDGAPGPAGFFAPDRQEGAYLALGGGVTWRRLALRAAVFVLALLLVDAAVGAARPDQSAYRHAYRLPPSMPMASVADYSFAIDAAAGRSADGSVAVFLGASPTWGDRIADARDSYPYAFASAAATAGHRVQAFNVASNGQYVGDEYVLARRLAPRADVVFVELTYHTFNPAAREGRSIRYPEQPRLLGVALPPEAARLLDLRPPDAPGPLPALDAALSRYWLLWRQRDALDARLFGGRPRTALDRVAAQALRGLPSTATVAADEAAAAEAKAGRRAASFDALDPRVQSVALRAYSMNASFTIDPRDPEVRLLRLLAASLAADGTRAVFYMTPLNRQVIADYELIDPKRYAANVATLREAIAPSGFPLLDYNSGRIELPSSLFADISHTTDAGGRAFGKLLARDSERYVWGEGR